MNLLTWLGKARTRIADRRAAKHQEKCLKPIMAAHDKNISQLQTVVDVLQKALDENEKRKLNPDQLKAIIAQGDILRCPDCQGGLLEGPSGGASTNFMCEKCGHKFNLTPVPGCIAWGERI